MSWLTLIVTALSMGFLGSFHCIGMCGPIALALPVAHLQGFRKSVGILFYNIGRAITYGLIGILFGYIGMQMAFFGWEQKISIALGISMILIVLFTSFGKSNKYLQRLQNKWNQPIVHLLSQHIHRKGIGALFIFGMLNGLLPCGLVYLAIVGSIESASIVKGAAFMFFFGIGTIPAMMSLSLLGNMASIRVRNKIKVALPYLTIFVGALLIIRGLNLDIPYVSPKIEAKKMSCCDGKE